MNIDKTKLKVALLLNGKQFQRAFHPDDLDFLRTFAYIINDGECPEIVSEEFMKEIIADAEACITCWGTPLLTKAVLEGASALKVIAHAAGSPKGIITADILERNIRIFTAAPIIAIDVAETALGAMITLLKGLNRYDRMMREGIWINNSSKIEAEKGSMKRLNYRLTVGIVSASHVGRNLIKMLKPFNVNIMLYDPYISEFEASMLGVKKVTLKELMSGSDVVTVHAPAIPQTYHMINKEMLGMMKDGTIFVNTARASVVEEDALVEELKTGRISAYLDVFSKEPLPKDSPLYALDNVILSPHIAGGHTENGSYERGNYIIQQLYNYNNTGVLQNEVIKDMIGVIA